MDPGSEAFVPVGEFIRQRVIPAGMSVKEAAGRLGVGRPALSNLLNGKAALSPNMAVRLEKSFGVDRQKLLEMQTAADRARRRGAEKAVVVRRYVPNFLSIKARQFESWADHLDARQLLPVLLRQLVHSTGHDLRLVNFPGSTMPSAKGLTALSKRIPPQSGFPLGSRFGSLASTTIRRPRQRRTIRRASPQYRSPSGRKRRLSS